jgi:hypothetical protein
MIGYAKNRALTKVEACFYSNRNVSKKWDF